MNSGYMISKSVSSGIDFATMRADTLHLRWSTTVSHMSTQRRLVFVSVATFLTLMISASASSEGQLCNETENVLASIFRRLRLKDRLKPKSRF